MSYKIELEDRGQDLIRLTVDENTGVITDAGLLSDIYANGDCVVHTEELREYRYIRFQRGDKASTTFKYPMTKLSLNGEILASA